MAAVAKALSGEGDDEGNEWGNPHEDVVAQKEGFPSEVATWFPQSLEIIDPVQLYRVWLYFRDHQQEIDRQHKPPQYTGQWEVYKQKALYSTSTTTECVGLSSDYMKKKGVGAN